MSFLVQHRVLVEGSYRIVSKWSVIAGNSHRSTAVIVNDGVSLFKWLWIPLNHKTSPIKADWWEFASLQPQTMRRWAKILCIVHCTPVNNANIIIVNNIDWWGHLVIMSSSLADITPCQVNPHLAIKCQPCQLGSKFSIIPQLWTLEKYEWLVTVDYQFI